MADPAFRVQNEWLDLPALAGAFSRRLHDAGVPSGVEDSAIFARALTLVRPVARGRLYWTARAVFVSDQSQVRTFDRVFAEVFGALGDGRARPRAAPDELQAVLAQPDAGPGSEPDRDPARERPPAAPGAGEAATPRGERERSPEREVPVALAPSDEEVLRDKRFDALAPDELARLYRLMSRLEVAPPLRRTRRKHRDRHGERIDLRRTLRASLRTGGDPVRLARRRRRTARRRMVLLCDISGSMEPYARAYLQFLTSAASRQVQRRHSEAFVFATRLTRVTRALASRNPERAIQRAAAAVPDWSSGTKIGASLKTFNDRYGRRGMARGAVIVILSDGWELHDPKLVGREMARLARVAYRIVWVNPRIAAGGFSPRTGGMAAALPHCDALVSGHSLAGLDEVVDAIAAPRGSAPGAAPAAAEPEPEQEPWASAGGWGAQSGSSVPVPSGYGPSRGNTTPGRGLGGR